MERAATGLYLHSCQPNHATRYCRARVLLNDWDPHNANRLGEARGAYDVYVEPLREADRNGSQRAGSDGLAARSRAGIDVLSFAWEGTPSVGGAIALEARET